MGLLDRFEQRLDRLVNGAFAKAFKAEVQPVEIASALQRELDDRAAVVSRGRTVVPNAFHVDLSPADSYRLMTYATVLRDEIATVLREYAEEQRYTFLGAVDIRFARDDQLDTGIFRVRSEARTQGAEPIAPGGVAPAPTAVAPAIPAAGRPAPRPTGRPTLQRSDGKTYDLVTPVTRIGRGTDVELRIDDPSVSRHHAEVLLGVDVVLRDLDSTNGTAVDGSPVRQITLQDGMTITVGSTTLTYRLV